MKNKDTRYSVDLTFKQIRLPPFQDILVLARNSPQGKIGLSKSFELLIPNGFVLVEVDEEIIEGVFIHTSILNKISQDKIIEVLRLHVFPFISEGELLQVDFKITVSVKNIEV